LTITSQQEKHGKMWKSAIEDAEAEITQARQRVVALKASIRLFRQKMDNGENFPADLKSQNELSATHK
jgi:phage shock protein A